MLTSTSKANQSAAGGAWQLEVLGVGMEKKLLIDLDLWFLSQGMSIRSFRW